MDEEDTHSGAGDIVRAPISNSVWLSGESIIAKYVARPVRRFMEVEASSGFLLIIVTAIALIWVNSPFGDDYTDFWNTHIDIEIGGVEIFTHDLQHFVNDVLMVLFFFVVGVEIKSEFVTGQLRSFKSAALPVVAAIGGMVVPALFYVMFNLGDGNLDGWAIPMATDIAFALGILSLLGRRIPRSLRIFLLTLAVADDIAAILVIAIFYTDNLEAKWLIGAIIVGIAIAIARRARIWYTPVYFLLGGILWWMTYRSGVHATIAGVAIGLLTPARPLQTYAEARGVAKWLEKKKTIYVSDVRWANFNVSESVSVANRVKTLLHPYTAYIIIPIFALANGGVEISSQIARDALSSEITLGIFFGLVGGKVLGVTLFSWLAVKLGSFELPDGIRWLGIVGTGILAGIGFTVAIFVSTLAFDVSGEELSQAKLGIFGASIIAAAAGMYLLHIVYKKPIKPVKPNTIDSPAADAAKRQV